MFQILEQMQMNNILQLIQQILKRCVAKSKKSFQIYFNMFNVLNKLFAIYLPFPFGYKKFLFISEYTWEDSVPLLAPLPW